MNYDEDAYLEGYIAYTAANSVNPYDFDTEFDKFRSWDDGWFGAHALDGIAQEIERHDE